MTYEREYFEEFEDFYEEMGTELFGYDSDAFWALFECIELPEF